MPTEPARPDPVAAPTSIKALADAFKMLDTAERDPHSILDVLGTMGYVLVNADMLADAMYGMPGMGATLESCRKTATVILAALQADREATPLTWNLRCVWQPPADPVAPHTVTFVWAGRDEPPESSAWQCACGRTFAIDGVDEYAEHIERDRSRLAPAPQPYEGYVDEFGDERQAAPQAEPKSDEREPFLPMGTIATRAGGTDD